jgi:enoyl-[acyl-carrier protein] reductase II
MNKITQLFNIKYPIIQGGMIWCSGWELASAVSNAGGLGLIGAGSMNPDTLRQHIKKCKQATNYPFGVNVPLLYSQTDEIIDLIIEEGVKIIFTSAGNPAKYTSNLKKNGIKVVHVVANKKFALKAQAADVDAIVAEGFEAGGHNGFEETTTMVMIPMLKEIIKIPIIAAGGIASGNSMYAAMSLGAEGVQIGSLFASSVESSAHQKFKDAIVNSGDGDTKLLFKKLIPVRLLKNEFQNKVVEAERECISKDELAKLLGHGRAKLGMFEGNLAEGEFEIGQIAVLIDKIKSVDEIIKQLIDEFNISSTYMSGIQF